MSDLKEKLKRQTEILGLCLQPDHTLSQADLQVLFKRDRPTITRDLSSLRSIGVDIHSTKHCVSVENKLTLKVLNEIILQYVGLNYSEFSYDKATTSLVKRQKEKALSNIVMLQRAIDSGTLAIIDYEKEPGKVEAGKTIAPWILFQGDNEWRVLAENDGIQKQYILSKVRKITPTRKKFQKPPQEQLREVFSSAWNAWLGGEKKYQIRIAFSPEAMRRYGHRQFVETQEFRKKPDGSAVLEATVNSLFEVAGWIVSHSQWVEALEPAELRGTVRQLAEQALRTHKEERTA